MRMPHQPTATLSPSLAHSIVVVIVLFLFATFPPWPFRPFTASRTFPALLLRNPSRLLYSPLSLFLRSFLPLSFLPPLKHQVLPYLLILLQFYSFLLTFFAAILRLLFFLTDFIAFFIYIYNDIIIISVTMILTDKNIRFISLFYICLSLATSQCLLLFCHLLSLAIVHLFYLPISHIRWSSCLFYDLSFLQKFIIRRVPLRIKK